MATTLTFYGGVGEIGGNKILLETSATSFTPLQKLDSSSPAQADTANMEESVRPTRLLLDFGISFKQEKEFFNLLVRPRSFASLSDRFRLNILPALPGCYRQDLLADSPVTYQPALLDGVLLSHAHADHVGNIPYLDPAITIYGTEISRALLDFLQETQAMGESSYVSGTRRVARKNQQRLKKEEKVGWQRNLAVLPVNQSISIGQTSVTMLPVDHSAPGAAAFIVETPDVVLIYSGDLRKHGHQPLLTHQFIAESRRLKEQAHQQGKPVVLLCEGTRFNDFNRRTEQDVLRDVESFVTQANRLGCLTLASFSVLDVDRLTTFYKVARTSKRKLALSPRQFYLLERLAAAVPPEQSGLPDPADPALTVFFPRKVSGDFHTTDYDKWSHSAWHDPNKRVTYQEVLTAPQEYIVFFGGSDLTTLLDFELEKQGILIYSRSEPHDPEMELVDQLWERWCDRFNLVRMTSHASGHASGLEIREIIREIGPDLLFPIHTQEPEAFLGLLDEQPSAVRKIVLPTATTVYDLKHECLS